MVMEYTQLVGRGSSSKNLKFNIVMTLMEREMSLKKIRLYQLFGQRQFVDTSPHLNAKYEQ